MPVETCHQSGQSVPKKKLIKLRSCQNKYREKNIMIKMMLNSWVCWQLLPIVYSFGPRNHSSIGSIDTHMPSESMIGTERKKWGSLRSPSLASRVLYTYLCVLLIFIRLLDQHKSYITATFVSRLSFYSSINYSQTCCRML